MTQPGDLKCYMTPTDKIIWFVVAIDEIYVHIYLMRIMNNWNMNKLVRHEHHQYDGLVCGWNVQALRCK